MRLSTKRKLAVARAIARGLFALGVKRKQTVRRGGILYELDLNEGIDLSIFLSGAFQRRTLTVAGAQIPPDGVVVDVGANVGAFTLPFARAVAEGRVIAIEPTEYAIARLRRNVSLNPILSDRITIVQSFAAERSSDTSTLAAYSSWRLVEERDGAHEHPVHEGTAMQASCGQVTIDDLLKRLDLSRVSLIKIDTDGHEYEVLLGASECLARHRPIVVFEACGYLMSAPRPTFGDFEDLFRRHGYVIYDPSGQRPIDKEEFAKSCPAAGGLDLVARPALT